MLLVDTSVWIDFFTGQATSQVSFLDSCLAEREDVCICGVILTEVLQGIRHPRDYRKVRGLFDSLVYLPMSKETYLQAAEIYRGLRRRGLTVRKPIDCMIAAVAIEHTIPLLHNDRDFQPIEKHFKLKTQ